VHGSSEPQFLSLQSLYISLSSNSYKMPSSTRFCAHIAMCGCLENGTGTSRPPIQTLCVSSAKAIIKIYSLLDSDSEEEEPAPIPDLHQDGSSSEFGQE